MMMERDADVHRGGTSLYLQLTLRPREVPAPGDEAQFRLGREHGKDVDIVEACERFVALLADLIKQFEKTQ